MKELRDTGSKRGRKIEASSLPKKNVRSIDIQFPIRIINSYTVIMACQSSPLSGSCVETSRIYSA